jgi:hypothetical protein
MQKKILFIALFSCIVFHAFAQEFELKKEVMYIDGVAIGKVDREDGLAIQDITFKNMEGKELIFAKINKVLEGYSSSGTAQHAYWYEVLFMENGKRLEYEVQASFSVERNFIKFIAKSGLIKNGQIDSVAERIFFMKYGDRKAYANLRNNSPAVARPASSGNNLLDALATAINREVGNATTAPNTANSTSNTAAPAQRNRTLPVHLQGKNIVQGEVIIGTVQQESGWTKGQPSCRWRKITAFFPNGMQSGQAYYEDVIGRREDYYTLSLPNGTTQTIGLGITESMRLDSSFVTYLVKNGWL